MLISRTENSLIATNAQGLGYRLQVSSTGFSFMPVGFKQTEQPPVFSREDMRIMTRIFEEFVRLSQSSRPLVLPVRKQLALLEARSNGA